MRKVNSVLIIDDDPTARFIAKDVLKKMGVGVKSPVLVASNGIEALQILQTHCALVIPDQSLCPELILLDINMPVMNGFQFLEALQNRPEINLSRTQIIVLTTSADPLDYGKAKQYPVSYYLTKPITKEKLEPILT